MIKKIGLLMLLVVMSNPVWAQAERAITTSGTGAAETVPDMATIDVGVTHQAVQAGDALRLTSEAIAGVILRLEGEGIEARDMQTQGVSLQPVRPRRTNNNDAPPQITGFVASNVLKIRVRNLDALGGILDAVVKDGANTFNGLRFSLQDPSAAMAEARAAAVKNAMDKASQLASAAGIRLGPIQSISESGGAPRPVMMEMNAARMAADVPVAVGEISLSAQVTMVFSILD